MKTSLSWLNSYLDQPVSRDRAEHLLTEQGMPLDGAEPVAGDAADWQLDVEVTSNRCDCLSHVGLAREVAAGAGLSLSFPDYQPAQSPDAPPAESLASVENLDTTACPLYTARVIRNVNVGPSPAWLVKRLEAIGLRSVNNVVDVTNFVLMELGQPLHAFDMDRLEGRRIFVRSANKGEPFDAIDGSKHQLCNNMLVIADAARPVAVAGVMGGLHSEVGNNTKDILLESAIFDPLSVRRTSRALKLASDSSYRFERGVDPQGVETASLRAAKLILELAGGQLASGVIRVGMNPPPQLQVTMRIARCHAVLGLGIPIDRIVEILTRLELEPELSADHAMIACRIPTFRLDLTREIDLIEEVARLHGFGEIAVQERIHIQAQRVQPEIAARRRIGQVMIAHGYHETINFSFIKPTLGEAFLSTDEKPLLIDDDRRKAEPMLRPALTPSLLACRKANQDAGNTGVRLYEVAATYVRCDGEIRERNRLALLCDADGDIESALRDVRGTLEELSTTLGGEDATLTIQPQPHQCLSTAARLELNGQAIGAAGVIDAATQQRFGLQSTAVVAEVELSPLINLYPPRREVRALPRFPGIERDLSIIVAETVAWQAITEQIEQAKPELFETVAFLGAYRGKPIPKGSKSVSFRMTFRHPQRTLRHDEVDPQVQAITAQLSNNLGATLRS